MSAAVALPKLEQLDQAGAEALVTQRFKEAKEFHKQFHPNWRANELTLFQLNGIGGQSITTYSFDSQADLASGDLDVGNSAISINYAFRYHRYLLGLMSSNPPSVIVRPTSADESDRRAAAVADDLSIYGRRKYITQEVSDQMSMLCLVHGTVWGYIAQDPWQGELRRVYKNGRVLMTGDFDCRAKSAWEVMRDPTAQLWKDNRYVFIMHITSREEAQARFGRNKKYRDRITAYKTPTTRSATEGGPKADQTPEVKRDTVIVWQYVEKGLPWNGMVGRQIWVLDDGAVVSDVTVNPNPKASLPVFPMTDVDVPGLIEGKSTIDYLVRLQDVLDRLDSTVLDNIQAHGCIRMVTFDAQPQEDNNPSNGPWQIMNIEDTGSKEPHFLQPPTMMPDIYRFRQQLLDGMEALAGTNEYMFGQIKREVSSYTAQTAISAGNMVRRRLFNKYKGCFEWMFKQYLMLVQEHWDDKRKVLVTGKEGAMKVAYYSGADLEGGFDIDAEYGTSFSLDPERRREEIMQLLPLLKEAGYTMRQILQMMKLNDIKGLFDMAETAAQRQMEIFDEMIAKYEGEGILVYIRPEELEEHTQMLNAAYQFRQSMAYKVLARPLKRLIERHILDREQQAAKPPRTGTPPAAAGAGPAAAGALPGLPAGLGGAGAAAPALPLA